MQKVNLNLIPGSVLPVINVSQYDEGRQFQLAVFNGAASYDLTGKTVVVDVQKTDGHGCEYGAADDVKGVPVVAVSGNIVTITTPQQMTACAGDCAGELKITDSTSTIGTLNFILMCEPAPLNDETIISDTELPDIIDAARSSAERAEDAAQDAEAAAAHYPYPGDDGYWYVWDVETEQFVKTDVSAAGRAPDITMTATADATSSPTPTVTVTKTGTDEEPDFALAFSGLKGAKGDTGPIGPTGDSQDVLEAVGWVGSNLFEGNKDTFTWAGITVTPQNNGTYLLTGTRTSTGGMIPYRIGTFLCKAGVEYKVSGCPTGGGTTSSDFRMNVYRPGTGDVYAPSDIGSGTTIPAFSQDTEVELGFNLPQSFVCPANFLWSPMISRNGGAYVPYHPTVERCMFLRSEQAVLGAKNRFKNYYTTLTRNTPNDVSKTQTEDGFEIQCSTTNWSGYYWKKATITSYLDQYPQGIKLSFEFKSDVSCACEVGTTTNKITTLPTTWTKWEEEYHSADECYNVSWYNKDTTKAPKISVRYPMIRLASDPDDTYVPYAETNFELTQNKFSSSNVAPTEDGAGASQAYSTGQYLIHNGELRKATTSIASGAAITDNNTDATTLAEILERNKNELVSGIAALSTDSTVFDISDATLTCVINRFTRRISISFKGVTLVQQLSVAGALAIITVANGYWGLIVPYGIATVRKDNTYYRAQLSKNTANTALAITAQETIPVGATISGYMEWPY